MLMGDLRKAKKLYQDGKNQTIRGNHKKAVKLYLEATKFDPGYIDVWLSLSNAYTELKKYEKAKEACKSALRIDEKNHISWINLGGACFGLGEYDKALKAYEQALSIKPEHTLALKNADIVRKKLKGVVEHKPREEPVIPVDVKEISIARGGDWKIEGNQSIFYYKVKVKNKSKFLIGNVQITLTSIPRGLETQTHVYKIQSLSPGSFESPSFKLFANESCVGDVINSIVSYTDPTGNPKTKMVKPFEICYVCNLLTPKEISKQEFDSKVTSMEKKELLIDSDVNIVDLESRITQIIENCNFSLIQQMENIQSANVKKIEGFAQGLYDKQDVALSITLEKVEEGSKIVVDAMSDKGEKVTDLLRDLSTKMDDIKSDTELIKEYTSLIEDIFNQIDNIENFLRDKLGSDFEKIKSAWDDYKSGTINKKQLIFRGIKTLGKKFVKKILSTSF